MMRYTRTQHQPASRQVNDHGRVSGTHKVVQPPEQHPVRHRVLAGTADLRLRPAEAAID